MADPLAKTGRSVSHDRILEKLGGGDRPQNGCTSFHVSPQVIANAWSGTRRQWQGHFRNCAQLGRGGMDKVYPAKITIPKRPVALKRISPESRQDPPSRQQLWK